MCHQETLTILLARTCAVALYERIDATFLKSALVVDCHRHYRCVARNTLQTDAEGCAEIAQTVGNEPSFIDFNAPNHMRTVTINHVGTMVNAVVCQLAQCSTTLAQKALHAVGYMTLCRPLGSTVERNDDDVALLAQLFQQFTHFLQVEMTDRIAVVT